MKIYLKISLLISILALCGCSLLVEVKDPPSNNANNTNCGNGSIDGNEACDAGDLGGKTCSSLGLGAGQLGCSADCRFDTSGCDNPEFCGNDVTDPEEECDLTDLNGATCSSLGLGSGTLSCKDDCHFDTTNCELNGTCGDGELNAGEQCEGTNLGGDTCETLGLQPGTLACKESCTFDTSGCGNSNCTKLVFDDCTSSAECCPQNGQVSDCVTDFLPIPLCMQRCTSGVNCGWSMECQTGHCFFSQCGPGTSMENQDINHPCQFSDGREGICDVSQSVASSPSGACLEHGAAPNGSPCTLGDHYMEFGIDPDLVCANGVCIYNGGVPNQGLCWEICDPIFAYEQKTNSCTQGACINSSDIVLETTDPRYLYRTPDQGICHTDPSFIACDVLSGLQLYFSSSPCPASGSACVPITLGSLIGKCMEIFGTGIAQGDSCQQDAVMCAHGLDCVLKNPLNETDPLGSADFACRQICDARMPEPNVACMGLIDDLGDTLICVSTSRFFTPDHEPLNSSFGTDSPSPLGFCVPVKR